MAFQLSIHPEARLWTPDDRHLAVLRGYFSNPSMRAHILPRRLANKTLGKNLGPYAFRAFTRGNDSYVFVDPTETRRSVAWILSHELAHQKVDNSPTVSAAFADALVPGLDRAGDEFHKVDAEERFCDGIATRLIGKRLDRDWWRLRTPR